MIIRICLGFRFLNSNPEGGNGKKKGRFQCEQLYHEALQNPAQQYSKPLGFYKALNLRVKGAHIFMNRPFHLHSIIPPLRQKCLRVFAKIKKEMTQNDNPGKQKKVCNNRPFYSWYLRLCRWQAI